MTAPVGLGGWVAFRKSIGTAQQAAALAVECGCEWVAPRAGAGGLNDAAFHDPTAEIAAYKAAGLRVYPWLYSYPGSWRAEVEAFRRLMLAGADGVIIDAEIEWQGHQAEAAAYMTALRVALPDAFIADAPWPLIGWHATFPAREFAAGVNMRMCQAYWTQINTSGAAWTLDKMDSQWALLHAAHPEIVRDMAPIGVTYGNRELKKAGAGGCPGEIAVADVVSFLDRYPGAPVSLYSLEVMAPEVKSALVARAAARHPATLRSPEVPRASSETAPLTEAARMAAELVNVP